MKVKELINVLNTLDGEEEVRLHVYGFLNSSETYIEIGSIDIDEITESKDIDNEDDKEIEIVGNFGAL